MTMNRWSTGVLVCCYGAGCYLMGVAVGRWNQKRAEFTLNWTDIRF